MVRSPAVAVNSNPHATTSRLRVSADGVRRPFSMAEMLAWATPDTCASSCWVMPRASRAARTNVPYTQPSISNSITVSQWSLKHQRYDVEFSRGWPMRR